MTSITLPYPHKILWPNGARRNRYAIAREVKKHRHWAATATRAAKWIAPEGTPQVTITVHPKPTGPHPDKDNVSSSAKSYLDGIADALGVNDRTFETPRVVFGERCPGGAFVLSIGGAE